MTSTPAGTRATALACACFALLFSGCGPDHPRSERLPAAATATPPPEPVFDAAGTVVRVGHFQTAVTQDGWGHKITAVTYNTVAIRVQKDDKQEVIIVTGKASSFVQIPLARVGDKVSVSYQQKSGYLAVTKFSVDFDARPAESKTLAPAVKPETTDMVVGKVIEIAQTLEFYQQQGFSSDVTAVSVVHLAVRVWDANGRHKVIFIAERAWNHEHLSLAQIGDTVKLSYKQNGQLATFQVIFDGAQK